MAESLKAARERVARQLWQEDRGLPAHRDACRELMKPAMEAVLAEQARCVTHHWPWTPAVLDALLDGPARGPHRLQEPPPHHPPRCIRCGLHEGIGHPGNHPFQPQSPRCHRAHPHDEPCA